MTTYLKTLLILFSLGMAQQTYAQNQGSTKTLSKTEKRNLISSIQTHLESTYVNLELSKKMVDALQYNINSNKYDQIIDPSEFSKTINQDLQEQSKDLHLQLRYQARPRSQNRQMSSEQIARRMAEVNYGFSETKILSGNIGYLNLRMFADTAYAEETATAAMHFLSNTKAIIIDLRSNRGGVPSMIQLLSSYFLEENPVLLSNFYERQTDEKTQLYSLAEIKGKKSTNKPLYLLTSNNTYSAAEAFAYTLKHLDKATVVGALSKGGANRTKRIKLNDNFTISIPYIEAVHPITQTNWEGKGVLPDIKTSSKDAFVMAYIDAITKTNQSNRKRLLNKIGYQFLSENQIDDAIITFQENANLFPEEANSWDSLGEAYIIKGNNEMAIQSYSKALELDPNSSSARTMLNQLKNKK